MKLPIFGAIASIFVLFLAQYLGRERILIDPVAVTFAALGVVGFAGFTVWAGIRSVRRAES
jgi:hypothetical protein